LEVNGNGGRLQLRSSQPTNPRLCRSVEVRSLSFVIVLCRAFHNSTSRTPHCTTGRSGELQTPRSNIPALFSNRMTPPATGERGTSPLNFPFQRVGVPDTPVSWDPRMPGNLSGPDPRPSLHTIPSDPRTPPAKVKYNATFISSPPISAGIPHIPSELVPWTHPCSTHSECQNLFPDCIPTIHSGIHTLPATVERVAKGINPFVDCAP
jgi:hypothetical protein